MSRAGATASELVIHFGMTARYWTRMASEGKVPGAWQPSGPGGKWLFDLDAVRRWQRSRIREVAAWPGYISAGKRIGVAPSVRARNIDSPSAPQIEELLKSVCGNG